MPTSLLLFVAPVLVAQGELASGVQLNYQGSLAAADADLQAASRKPFDLACWIRRSDANGWDVFWLLDERSRGEWPWIERFGAARIAPDGKTTGDSPALLETARAARPRRQDAGRQDVVPFSCRSFRPVGRWRSMPSGRTSGSASTSSRPGSGGAQRLGIGRGRCPRAERNRLARRAQSAGGGAGAARHAGGGDQYVLKLELLGSEQLDAPAGPPRARRLTPPCSAASSTGRGEFPRSIGSPQS